MEVPSGRRHTAHWSLLEENMYEINGKLYREKREFAKNKLWNRIEVGLFEMSREVRGNELFTVSFGRPRPHPSVTF